jgi:hypothetical protein
LATTVPTTTAIIEICPSAGEGDLRVGLVGGHLDQGLVALHEVTLAHEPPGHGPFRDTLSELRHEDINHRCLRCSSARPYTP